MHFCFLRFFPRSRFLVHCIIFRTFQLVIITGFHYILYWDGDNYFTRRTAYDSRSVFVLIHLYRKFSYILEGANVHVFTSCC